MAPTFTMTPALGVAFVTRAPPTVPVLQTTPTPMPTPTETPTPTPIVYQVAAGDTIWVIAARSNRTVDEVLELNPGVRPDRLQIGQSLILPPPATPIFDGGAATPIPIDVRVAGITTYQTPQGGLWLLGRVFNDGPAPAEGVQVAVELLDAAGQALWSGTAWPAGLVLPAEQQAPFGLLVAQPPPVYAHTRVAVIGGQTTIDLGTRYLDLIARVDSARPTETRIAVTGTVENVGDAVAGPLLLVATFIDGQDRVAGFTVRELAGPLAPGERLGFAFEAAPPGGQVATVMVTAQGLVAGAP